jgi:DNA-binding PadR family transcriptional regulator
MTENYDTKSDKPIVRVCQDDMTNRWRHRGSDPILLLLFESGVGMAPMDIKYNLRTRMTLDPPADSTIEKSLQELRDADMIERPVEGQTQYELTEAAVEYVRENLDPNGGLVRGYSSSSHS